MRYLSALNLVLLFSSPLLSQELLVRTPIGDTIMVEIDHEMPFYAVLGKIEDQICSLEEPQNRGFLFDYMMGVPNAKAVVGNPRGYHIASKAEQEDIRFIVTTLAKSSWLQLLSEKSTLKKAGDRIDRLHPFQFLRVMFSSEELKGCLRCIRDRKKIWSEFFEDGLAVSLEEEARHNNLTAYIEDFASSINIPHGIIAPTIQKRQWETLLDLLIKHLPCQGAQIDRYNQ